jgi:2-C-methyl-D-erythritol 4-phosphate cytidylyltransferase
MKAVAVIVAGGKSIRFGGETPKQFAKVCGRMLLAWTVERFERASSVESICIVVPADAVESVAGVCKSENFRKVLRVVAGGTSRSQSVLAGLHACPEGTGLVAIHDGARPLVAPSDIDRVVAAATAGSAAILAIPASDAIKKTSDGVVRTTIDRTGLYYAQTPQVFELSVILRAYEARGKVLFADDAALVEEQGVRVQIVEPTFPNIKVTRPEDILLIEGVLKREDRG